MLQIPPLSLYIHIPWCEKMCPYCDFNSYSIQEDIPQHEYVKHLLSDLENDVKFINQRQVKTIFIGGGTPSLFSAESIQALIGGIRQRVNLDPQAEITIEANPGTIEEDRFYGYKKAGINRISIGVQSFDSNKLIILGRIHGPEAVKQTVSLTANLNLYNFNLDLMHGLPLQTCAESLSDLNQAIQLAPKHLSWYQLTIEPHTQYGTRPPILPDDDILWKIYSEGHQLITESGYQQYETSTYAKPGYQCQHNLNYWRFGDYLGIGCGAHGKVSFLDGRILRTIKTKHPRGYMSCNYLQKLYDVNMQDRPFEYFMNRFRLLETMPRYEFSQYTGLPESVIRTSLDAALAKGYITQTKHEWQITEQGKLFLNLLLEFFLVKKNN
ncbi:hypothetical protein GFV14_00300 [Candidatus Hartigia pinicola]|nr:hypothetical protein GFV14_00300 [Candidatus Hartigia pinicola]